MNETKLRNADANLEVEGILSEKALELITDKNNKNVIRGYVVFKLNDLDFVTVNVYVSEFTKNGEASKAYPNVLTVMNEYKSIAEVGEDAADRVRCKSVQVQPNSYVGKEDLMVHENVRYSASFFTRITDPTKYEPTARMEIEAYVQSVIDEFTVQGEATGRLKVKLYIPTYKGVEPMDAYISETIAEDFKDMVSIGQTVLLAGMPINRNEIKENVQNVYDYLMSLNGKEASPGGIVLNGVQAAPLSTGTSGTADVLLKFKLENDRHGGITLDEKDVLTLTANNQIFPCSEWKNEGNGTYSVMLQGVTAGENIDVTISGEQYLARDAYFYEPVSGRNAAQCFVGVAEGMTPVFANGSFKIDGDAGKAAYLSVKKTSNMPGTYKFNVYKAENDTKELINTVEITTAEANTCVASEKILLPVGTYIVEEEDAIKAGYTLIVTVDGKEHTVNSEKVENPSVQVTLQENSEAEVTVNFVNCYEEIPSSFGFKKTDEHDAGVKGAVFALFKDEDCKEPTAYKQTSDSNGDVKFPLIPVGIYYMKETAAPYGYYLNKEVFKIEVLVQETSGTDNVAIYRRDAQDQWVKVEGSLEVENSRKPENHYTPEEPVPAIVVMPKTGDGSVLLSAAGLLLAAAAVCGLKRRIRG